MKAYLLYPDADFQVDDELPWGSDVLTADLELETLFATMAQGDGFLLDIARQTVLRSLATPDLIFYRQAILGDCEKHVDAVRLLYDIAVEAVEIEKKTYFGIYSHYPAAILSSSRDLMQSFIAVLRKLRNVADASIGEFRSEGFTRFFAMIRQELSDEYFDTLATHLKELKFGHGTLISASLGRGNKGVGHTLRKLDEADRNFLKRLFERHAPSYTFHIADRDEAGARALSELEGRGIGLAADAVHQSAQHVLSFFQMIRVELAFYIGCLNLINALEAKGQPTTYPVPMDAADRQHGFEGLYDVCLALRVEKPVVPNDGDAPQAEIFVITGANEGGKSTFLRSIGVAQILMQAGMKAGARTFSANVANGVFTHYKREEDASMTSGKFDEELVRMNALADHIKQDSMVLFNESFASTNEREGSEVARQIVRALVEQRVKVLFVTHMYDFAHSLFECMRGRGVFLRAERYESGERTFRVAPGEPLETSYGEDLYRVIFDESTQPDGKDERRFESAEIPSGR
ncbi:MutS-related protein [Caballeronia sp. J97]|uniref:MutS-related protein n=1 Tax=Caballeronia sp. J97 TaxID=2805429 RepID=UPI002AAF5240|nr:DNA mismatch repair protein MutS [Caballeronia sp. J97]